MEPIILSSDDQFNDFVTDYLDGTLALKELQVFREYLSIADAERKYVEKAQKGKKALSKLPQVRAAADFEEKLARRLAEERELSLIEEDL